MDPPGHSEVIYVLGGETWVPEMGLRMLDEGQGDILVLNWVREDRPECLSGQYKGHRVICARPLPATTQGEAMQLPVMMQEHGWTSVTVATWRAHIPRSRTLFERCYGGDMRFRPTTQHYGRRERLAKAAYESFSYIKVAVTPGCDDTLPFGLSD
ncbi:MAG: hypothetical protein Q4G46_13635 [Propionibacteriaceae bacterium]|nr:hypothetical protein [Propionibacteriaceae bacterium]